jgi:MFS family permease
MPEPPRPKRFFGLSRNVFVFGFVSLLNDLSSEITIRTLPLFLANVLGVKTSIIGLIEGIADSTSTLLKMVSGWLSDKFQKRKPLVLAGYALSSFSKPLFYFAMTWPFVLLLRFLDRVGKGIRTSPRDALIADSTDLEHQGRAFGYNRAMDPVGAVFGLLAAAAFVTLAGLGTAVLTRSTYQTLVLIAAVPASISVLLIIFFIKDQPPQTVKHDRPRLSLKGFDRRFKIFLAINVVFTLGNSSDAFLILRSQQLGLSLIEIFIMLAMFNLTTSLVSFPAGVLSDKIGRHKVIIAGWLIYGLIYLGFAVARSGWQVWVLFTLYGFYYGATEGVAKALVADVVPHSDKRGTAYGLYNAAVGVSAFPASLIAGVLWQSIGPAAPFLFGSVLALGAMVAMTVLIPAQPAADSH